MKIFVFFILIYVFNLYNESEALSSDELKLREPRFIFTYPLAMFSGMKATACLNLIEARLPTKMLIDFKINKEHHTTMIDVISESSCFPLNVPSIDQNYKILANIDVQLQLNDTVQWYSAEDLPYIYPNPYTTFIETDKSFYKMGEKVKMRFLILGHDLRPPNNYKIPNVKLYNPHSNTVAVWKNVPTELGLAQEDFQLAEDTSVGRWKIEVNGYTKTFQVKRYILPRFKVKLFAPKSVYVRTKFFSFHVCAKYVYGKSVVGVALIKLSYAVSSNMKEVHKSRAISNGCVKFKFTSDDLPLDEASEHHIFLTGTVTENGTNVMEIDTMKMRIVHREYEMKFVNEQEFFQPGFPYRGKLKLSNIMLPMRDEIIQICYEMAVKKVWNIRQRECKNFTINTENVINFTLLPMKENVVQLKLQAIPISRTNYDISANTVLKKWYSKSRSSIYIEKNHRTFSKCGSNLQFTVYYISNNLKEHENVSFNYIMTSRGEILKLGNIAHKPLKQKLNLNEMRNVIGRVGKFINNDGTVDKFTLKFALDRNVYTKANLLIYYATKEEIIVGNADIQIEKCLPNLVKAKWASNKLYPGEMATLHLKTDSYSLCALSSVDKATTYLGSFKILNTATILKSFSENEEILFSYKKNCLSADGIQKPANIYTNPWDLRKRRQLSDSTSNNFIINEHSSHFDSYEVFKKNNIGVISNLKLIAKPCEKGQTNPHFLIYKPNDLEYEIENEDRGTTIRSYFPETWLWNLVLVGKDGDTKLEHQLPDTITNWVTNVLCVSPYKGVGISQTIELTAFKPFFLDILTPYSIKNHEVLHLTAIVHNYLNHSIPVKLTLGQNNGLDLLNNDNKSVTFCLNDDSSATHSFRLKPYQIGYVNISVLAEIDSSYPENCGPDVIINRKDLVYKSLLVESAGYPTQIVKSAVLCANDSIGYNNVSWNLQLTDEFVPNSVIGKIVLNSDLMGPVIQNLENLIVVPTGCGEQIMSVLTPNLFVLRYLKASNKLTKSLYQRALRNMKIGYQKILDYVHNDGSFSAFGYHDPSGSMFLTSFVIRTLKQIKEYIHVDENVINRGISWITKHQLENGCFDSGHHVFHELGGMNTENSTAALTAYVLITLLESNTALNETIRTNAKYCIRGTHQPDKYTLAISTYALYLVEWYSQADRNLEKLLQLATKEGDSIWWGQQDMSLSVSIEMTSYVLMSLLQRNSSQNLYYATSIVKWLHSKIGSRGEFTSTQDTSVALDALSRYISLVHKGDPQLNVTVATDTQKIIMSITKRDRLKMKYVELHNIPTKVDISISGEGCILTQAVVTYNMNHMNSSQAFRLAVDVEPVSTIDKCSVAIISPCIAYMGAGHSNMAVLEVTMPSGYEPDRTSLFELTNKDNTKVKKFEELQNRVVLYFTELTSDPVCVPFSINENIFIENVINTTIKLYDYYKPELFVIKNYKVNTCQSNVITPIPVLPESTIDFKNINVTEQMVNRSRRSYDDRMNNFLKTGRDLDTPDGLEGNIPVYVAPPKTCNASNAIH